MKERKRERALCVVRGCRPVYIDFFTYLLFVAHFLVSIINLQRLQQSGFCLATAGYVLKYFFYKFVNMFQ